MVRKWARGVFILFVLTASEGVYAFHEKEHKEFVVGQRFSASTWACLFQEYALELGRVAEEQGFSSLQILLSAYAVLDACRFGGLVGTAERIVGRFTLKQIGSPELEPRNRVFTVLETIPERYPSIHVYIITFSSVREGPKNMPDNDSL